MNGFEEQVHAGNVGLVEQVLLANLLEGALQANAIPPGAQAQADHRDGADGQRAVKPQADQRAEQRDAADTADDARGGMPPAPGK